jgi:membrane-associated protein
MCGVARIDPKKFAIANALSATIWGAGFIYLGFVVGERLEGSVDRYLVPVLLLIMVLSMMPIFTEIIRERRQRRE